MIGFNMITVDLKKYLLFLMLTLPFSGTFGQGNVPLGIHYQAVARDNYGKELASRKIDVRFSVISGNPLGTLVYQELHSHVITSKLGVFSLIIGQGVPTGGTFGELSQIEWDKAFHYLKVDVKFDNDFIDMGTMQFLAVPYALYAQKSLEPGPPGPKGDAGPAGPKGDPASDNQTLSVLNLEGSDYLAISGGNQVKISSIERDGDPTNELQDLIYDKTKMELSLLKSNAPVIDLSGLKNDADADPANEIQDLQLAGNILKVTGKSDATPVNLAPYLDNTDNQQLSYSESTNTLSIDRGNSVTMGSMIAFRAKKTISDTNLSFMTDYDFTTGTPEFNDGGGFNYLTGVFTAPFAGIYTFNVSYNATGTRGFTGH